MLWNTNIHAILHTIQVDFTNMTGMSILEIKNHELKKKKRAIQIEI